MNMTTEFVIKRKRGRPPKNPQREIENDPSQKKSKSVFDEIEDQIPDPDCGAQQEVACSKQNDEGTVFCSKKKIKVSSKKCRSSPQKTQDLEKETEKKTEQYENEETQVQRLQAEVQELKKTLNQFILYYCFQGSLFTIAPASKRQNGICSVCREKTRPGVDYCSPKHYLHIYKSDLERAPDPKSEKSQLEDTKETNICCWCEKPQTNLSKCESKSECQAYTCSNCTYYNPDYRICKLCK